jgi:serine/threonine protein kinase
MSTTPQRLGKYELQERLGHGGVAEVWKALDTQLQRYVALKLLRPDLREDHNFIQRFKREAQLIASLHHPNIVKIHDFQIYQPAEADPEESPPIAYMVMDYVEGQTLADYIQATSRQGQFPPAEEIVNIFAAICLAIDYAHREGMIHRDIKPANILLDRRNITHNKAGEPILTDFGVAKLLGASSNTQSGALLGTPLYISPEQAQGYPGNERSDLYSLGVILYEIVTGTTPFRGDTAIDVIRQHINAVPTAPSLINPAIPPTLAQVIMRSLAKDPAIRFPSASFLAAAIADALHLPTPESLGQSAYPGDPEDMPTIFASSISQSGILPLAGTDSSPLVRQGPISSVGQASSQPERSHTPASSTPISQPGVPSQPNYTPILLQATPLPVHAPPPAMPTQVAPPPAPPRGGGRRPKTRLYLILTGVLLLLLLAGGSYALLPTLTQQAVTNQAGGRAFYISSGQIRPNSAQGIADGLQINLQNIPSPQQGNSYYLWLLGDRTLEPGEDLIGGVSTRPVKPPLLLTNDLPVRPDGMVSYRYNGDAQHNNLISATSRLLIAELPSGQNPTAPPERSTWRYYAEIPQAQIPGANAGFSALVHIRHLFYNETNIAALALPGGLDIWLFRNTEKILEFTASARDYWHGKDTNASEINLMKDHFIRIADYLNGTINHNTDLPQGTPVLGDPAIAKIGLITVDPKLQSENLRTNPPGYVDHVQLHVGNVAKAPDVTPEMRQTTARIIDSVSRAKNWLQSIRKNLQQLLTIMDDPEQLKQSSTATLLDDMATLATYAYIGQINPVTNQVEGGVLQAHYEIQQLAAFVVTTKLPQSLD